MVRRLKAMLVWLALGVVTVAAVVWRRRSDWLDLAGIAFLVIGFWYLSPAAGWITLGCGLLLKSFDFDRRPKEKP